MVHFSMPNSILISWLYILIVCISLQFFFIFYKQLDVVHVPEVVNLYYYYFIFSFIFGFLQQVFIQDL